MGLRSYAFSTALVSSLALSSAASADSGVVNIFNWSNYIGANTLAEFQAATKIRPVYDVYDSNETLEARLLAGKSNYDIVVPSNNYFARQVQAGVYQTLDKSKLPNYGNLDPALLERIAANDPGNAHGIPYMWGTVGIGYNKAMVRERLGTDEIVSWNTLFDPANVSKLADCGIAVLDSPSEVIPIALNYLGLDPYAENADELKRGMEALSQLRPSIRYIHSAQSVNDLASGAICVAIGYSGDVIQARTRAAESGNKVEIGYAVPREGSVLWVDIMGIPADAPNADNAYAFMNYILRPEVTAELTNQIGYASGNKAALPLVRPDVASDPATFPTPEIMEKLFVARPFAPRFERLVNRAWSEFRTGR